MKSEDGSGRVEKGPERDGRKAVVGSRARTLRIIREQTLLELLRCLRLRWGGLHLTLRLHSMVCLSFCWTRKMSQPRSRLTNSIPR